MHVQVKPNFRILGKKIGQLMPKAKIEIEKFSSKEIERLKKNQPVSITLDGQSIEITQEDVQIDRIVKEDIAAAAENEVAIAYDTKLSKELLEEGIARELVNKINTMRREEGLEVQDRIEIKMETTPYVKSCFEKYKEYICKEVLATQVSFETCIGTSWDINGEDTTIAITKAQ
jgi:isoleucyl-tRNA synthetase